jgi:hypothetical protein
MAEIASVGRIANVFVLAASLVACADARGTPEDDEGLDGSSDGSEDGPEGEPVAVPSCPEGERIDGLPYAMAWREPSTSGEVVLRVHVQSDPVDCGQAVGSVSHGSRIELRIPTATVVPARVELGDVQATARMSAGAPDNSGQILTLTWLDGELDVDAIDDQRVVATIRDTEVPFVGCFDASICAD